MIRVKVVERFTVTTLETNQLLEPDDLDAQTDQVMDELVALESPHLMNADVSVVLTEGLVEISIVAAADDFYQATITGNSAIRTAIHAAGGHTPRWETPVFSPMSASADLVDA